MAYSPIALIAPNYRDYGAYWLKAYTPGSTSPKSLSIDPVATTLFSKLQLNVDGFFKSAGGALITPHIEGSYDAYLFATLEEAEANNTAAAIRVADNITPVTTTGSIGFTITTAGLKSTNSMFAANTVIMTSGYTTSGDNGKGRWKQTGVTGLTPSQSPSQLFGALLTDGLGNQWALINDGKISISQLGGLVGSNNGAVVFAFNASSANTLDLEGLTWPARDIDCDNAVDKSKLQKSFINGTLIVVNSFVNDVDVQTIQPFAQDEIAVSGKKSQTLTWKDKRVLWLGTSIPHQGVDADGYPELLSSTLDFNVSNWSWSGSHAFYNIAGDAFDSGTVRALSMTESDRLAGLALYGASSAYDDSFNNITIASEMTADYRIKNQFIANAYDVVVLDHNHNDRKSVQTYTVNDKTLTAITKGATTVVAVSNTTGLTVGDAAYLEVTGIANLQYAAARITAISSLDVTLAIDSSGYAGTFIAGTLHWVDRNTLEGSFDFLIAYTKNMGIIYGNSSVDIILCNAPSYFTNNTNRDYSIWSSGKTIKKVADKWSLGYFDVAATLDLIYSQHLIYFPDEIHPSTLETRKALAAYWAEWMSGGKQTVVNHAETLAKNKLILDAHQEIALFSKYDDAYAYRANLFTDDTPIISEDFSSGIGTWTVTSTPPVIEAAPWGAGQAAKFVVTAGTPQPFIAKTSALAFDPILEFDLYFPTISLATGVSNQLTVFSLTTADLTTYNVAVIQSVGGTARLNISRSDTDVVSVNMPTYLIEAATKYTIKVDIIKGDTTSSNGYVLITVNGVKLYAGAFANGGVAAVTSTVLGAIFNNMGSDFNFFISNIVTGGKTRSPAIDWSEIQKPLTTLELIASTGTYAPEAVIKTICYSNIFDGGRGRWAQNGVTGQTPSQSPAQLVDGLLNDGNGNQWALVSSSIYLEQFNVILDNTTDNNLALAASIAFQQHNYKKLNSGAGYCRFSAPFEVFSSTHIDGAAISRSKSTTGNVNDDGLVFKYTGAVTAAPLIYCNLDGSQSYVHALKLTNFRLDCGGSQNGMELQGLNEYCLVQYVDVGNYTHGGIKCIEHDSAAGRFVNNQPAFKNLKLVPSSTLAKTSYGMFLREVHRGKFDQITVDAQASSSTNSINYGFQFGEGCYGNVGTALYAENCDNGFLLGEFGAGNDTVKNNTFIGCTTECPQFEPADTTIGSYTGTISIGVFAGVKWYSFINYECSKAFGSSPFSYDYLIVDAHQDRVIERSNVSSTSDRVTFITAAENKYGREIWMSDAFSVDNSSSIADFEDSLTANSAYPSAEGSACWKTNNSTATTITGFGDGQDGQKMELRIRDANTSIDSDNTANGDSILLVGGTDLSSININSTFIFRKRGTSWIELSRMLR
jgi:hypothetical protein